MKKPYYFIIPLVIYPFDVLVSIGQSDADLFKVINTFTDITQSNKKLLAMSNSSRGRTVMLHTNQTVIRIKIVDDRYEMIGTISHEIFHAVTFILEHIGMKFSLTKSDEAYAYMVGYLTKEIFKKMKL